MSVSSATSGSDLPAGSPLPDEAALEREFRSHFAVLTQSATSELAEAATSAPRVVEAAFRHAWEERERFHNRQELDAYLHDAIKHGAARERSRRAGLHRIDAHESLTGGAHHTAHATTAPDVDQAWAHFSQSLHRGNGNEAASQAKAGVARHGTAEHVAALAKQPSWLPAILVGVGALVIALGGIWYVNRLGDEGAIGHALAAADARPHVAATAQMAIVSLDDGSKVTLAPESKLIVPKNFSDVMRVVKLDGAGTFTAAPAGRTGLQIRAGNAAVTTTGTVLTVRAYPEDDAVTVFVKEGTVTMRVGDSTYTVAAGKALRAEKNGQVHEPTPEQLDEAISWTDHTVTIANRQLRDVLPQLKRWYGLDIKVIDLPLLDRPVSIKATADSPREAITAVEKSADLKFGYMDKTMVFRDARPPAKDAKKRG